MLRCTSLPAYQLLVKHFPLPSVSLLKRLSQEGVEPLKAVRLLLNERKIDKDIVLLIDEMCLQKELKFQQCKLIGCDDNGNLFKGIMIFVIVEVQKNAGRVLWRSRLGAALSNKKIRFLLCFINF